MPEVPQPVSRRARTATWPRDSLFTMLLCPLSFPTLLASTELPVPLASLPLQSSEGIHSQTRATIEAATFDRQGHYHFNSLKILFELQG